MLLRTLESIVIELIINVSYAVRSVISATAIRYALLSLTASVRRVLVRPGGGLEGEGD